MKIDHLDYLALTVKSIKVSCQFDPSGLGFKVVTFQKIARHSSLDIKI